MMDNAEVNKVLVYGGKGVNEITEMIERELPIKVMKVYSDDAKRGSDIEIRREAEEELAPYLGKMEVIVLAEEITTLSALEYLMQKYPKQKFIGYGTEVFRVIQRKEKVIILVPEEVRRYQGYQEMKAKCQGTEILEVVRLGEMMNCDKMLTIIKLAEGELAEKLGRSLGWRAEILDVKRLLMRDLCLALGLRGVDGRTFRERII